MLRIILLVGNIGWVVYFIIASTMYASNLTVVGFVLSFAIAILFILNVYFIIRTYRGSVSLYSKRKELGEVVKIQEAENKLKELKSIGLSSSKNKEKRKV